MLTTSRVVLLSVWRLYSIIQHRAGLYPYPDFTWWGPVSFLLSCLEIDLAILTCSVPIFFPRLRQSFAAIFVSHEIKIEEECIEEEHGLAYQLEHVKTSEPQSFRSNSAASTYCLTNDLENGGSESAPQFSVGMDPLGEEAQSGAGLQTHIRSSRVKSKWEI